jgi:DNA-binding phage protein
MKRKASISHDEVIIRRLRKNPDFAAEYLKAALEDEEEPSVLLMALRHLAQPRASPKSLRLLASSARVCTGHCRFTVTLACPH